MIFIHTFFSINFKMRKLSSSPTMNVCTVNSRIFEILSVILMNSIISSWILKPVFFYISTNVAWVIFFLEDLLNSSDLGYVARIMLGDFLETIKDVALKCYNVRSLLLSTIFSNSKNDYFEFRISSFILMISKTGSLFA